MNNPGPDEYTRTSSCAWTLKYPRPEKGDGTSDHALALRQQQWDASEALRQKVAKRADEVRAERETKEREGREAAENARQAQEQTKLDALTAALRRAYFSGAPGTTEEQFQKALPELLEARRRQSATSMNNAASREHSKIYQAL